MTQQEFNEMLSVAVAQGIVGGTYISKYDGEEIDAGVARALSGGEIDNLRPGQNLLDNWYFADPVNQRGQTNYHLYNGYTIDRWYISGHWLTVTLMDGYLELTSSSEADAFLNQKVERPQLFSGFPMTISVLAQKISGDNNCYILPFADKYIDGTPIETEKNVYSVSFQNTISNDFKFIFQIGAGCTIRLYAAKLELGSHQTLAHQDASGSWVLNDPPPNKALELAKCQRYFMRYIVNGPGISYYAAGKKVYVQIPLSPNMRIAPVLLNPETIKYSRYGGSGLWRDCKSVQLTNNKKYSTNICVILPDDFSGEISEVRLYSGNVNGDHLPIWLSADL